jgi:hypothetical protein
MIRQHYLSALAALAGLLSLGLLWWAWRQSGLAFLQLGMGVC